MHICFATLDYPTGGAGGGVATVTRLLAQGMAERGHRVSVFKLGSAGEKPYQDGAVQVYPFTQGAWHYYLSRLPLIGKHLGLPGRELERSRALAKALQQLHAREPIDVIEFSEEAVFFSAFSPLRKQCHYVARLHGTEHAWVPKVPGKKLSLALKWQRALQRYFLQRCPNLLAVSEFYKNDLKNDLGANAVERILVLGNPISLAAAPPQKQITPPALPTFLFVGRIQDTKGIDLLLRTLGKLKKAGYAFRQQVVGGHHPSIGEKRYQSLLAEAELNTEVETLGYQNKQQIAALMRACTAVVVPSYFETFGLVGLEALAQGARLVHSKVGIMADLDLSEVNQVWLFPPGHQNDLVQVLQKVAKESLSEPAQVNIKLSDFKPSFELEMHLNYFEELINTSK